MNNIATKLSMFSGAGLKRLSSISSKIFVMDLEASAKGTCTNRVTPRYASPLIVFVENITRLKETNNIQFSELNTRRGNKNSLSAIKFWLTCWTTRDYLVHGVVDLERTPVEDFEAMAENMYHLYMLLGIDLCMKSEFHRYFQLRNSTVVHYADHRIDFSTDRLRNWLVLSYAELQTEFENLSLPNRQTGCLVLYTSFGRLVHLLVGTRDSRWPTVRRFLRRLHIHA